MKRAGVISTAILFLLLGTTAPAYAQHEKQGHEKQDKDQGKSEQGKQHQQGKPAQQQHQQQAGKPAQQPHQQPAQQKHQQQARKPAQPRDKPQVHHSGVPQQRAQVRSGFVESRARSWDHDHRSWAQRGGYHGYRIPEQRFRLYFGREHHFRIYGRPMVFVGGYPRFRYDRYWVTFVDPWPEMWPATWYETDDVYVDYIDDGYYIFNRTRPGPRIAVVIAF